MRFATRTAERRFAIVLAIAVAITIALDADAQDAPAIPTTEYTVRPGDTCAIIAGRLYGSRQRHDIIHAYNPSMGPPPHDLVPGTILTLPVSAPDAASVPDARVTQIRREVVSRSPSSEEWRRATRGEALFRGYRVNALERSSAQLTFRDTSVLEIRANTLVVIFGASSGAARATTGTATLETGTLRTRLGSLRMTVDTPSASAELDGGSSVISTDDAGSRVASHDGGAVRVRSAARRGATVRLPPGFGSVVAPGTAPSPPRPLPPPPRFDATTTGVFAAFGDHGAIVRGRFEPVASATSYHVEIVRAGSPPEVITSVDVPATVTEFELRDVPVGVYEVTVASIDAERLEGVPGSPAAIRVVGVGMILPGGDESSAPTGESEQPPASGGLSVPPGTVLSPSADLVCAGAAADGSIRLDAIGDWAIECHLGDGGAVGGLELVVRAPTMTLALGADARQSVERGGSAAIVLERAGYVAPLPESARFEASAGLRVIDVSDDGRTITVAADANASDDAWIALVLADRDGRPVELARLPLAITSPPVAPEVATSPVAEEPPLRPGAGVADLVADPYVIGARASAREDLEATASVGAGSYADERPHLSGRFDVSIRAHDRIRLDLGVVGTVDRDRSPNRFGGSGFVAGWRVTLLRGDDRGLVASVDLVAPLHPSPTLHGPMLRSAIGGSLRMSSRSFLRPGVGALADLGGADGLRAMSTSVAAIFVVDRRLAIGWLVDTRLGRYDDSLHAALGIGAHLGLEYDRAAFVVFGRTEPIATGSRLSPTWAVGVAARGAMRIR